MDVLISEGAPHDGLQNVAQIVPLAANLRGFRPLL
jgi:hypothetical protein